jgi:hypothetical protein
MYWSLYIILWLFSFDFELLLINMRILIRNLNTIFHQNHFIYIELTTFELWTFFFSECFQYKPVTTFSNFICNDILSIFVFFLLCFLLYYELSLLIHSSPKCHIFLHDQMHIHVSPQLEVRSAGSVDWNSNSWLLNITTKCTSPKSIITQCRQTVYEWNTIDTSIPGRTASYEGYPNFPDWPPGAKTANDTALCHYVQLYRYFVSFTAITLCVASQRVFIVVYFVMDSVLRLWDTPS